MGTAGWRWIVPAGLALLAGCVPAATGTATTAAGHELGPGDWRTDNAPAAQAMAALGRTLARHDFAPTGDEGRAFIVRQRTLTVPLEVEAGRCYVFASTSSNELADLDSYLFHASGAPIDQDRRRDSHPTIRHCPAETGRLYLAFEAFDGNGLFYWTVFAGPGDSALGVEDLFPDIADQPGAPDPAAQGSEPAADRARVFAEIMLPRGFTLAEQAPPIHLANGADDTRTLELSADLCYTFAAYGGAGATDVDLVLTAPDGQIVALDEAPALDAYVQWCPVTSGTFALKTTMAGQAGEALLCRLEAPLDRVGGLDGLWLGERRPPGPTHRDLEDGAAQLRQRLERLGYRVDDAEALQGTADQMVLRTHSLALTADKCHVFGAVGGPDVADLDLYLYDRHGNEVAADESQNATPLVQVCPQQNETFRLDVAMRGGSGPYRVLRGASPAVGAEAMRELDTVARTRLRAVVDRIHLAELEPLAPPQTAELRARGVRRFQNDLAGGQCLLFVAVGSQNVVDIDLYVMGPDEEVVGRDDQPDAMPSVQFCAASDGTYSTDVRLIEGSGSFTLLQYRTAAPTAAAGGTP
ncbi:MAG: hypothetical protein JXB32_09710 [Deltaproteobacteria bacterium]|nr:hypothetical protein [Deltaproteobacteria bacterium]